MNHHSSLISILENSYNHWDIDGKRVGKFSECTRNNSNFPEFAWSASGV